MVDPHDYEGIWTFEWRSMGTFELKLVSTDPNKPVYDAYAKEPVYWSTYPKLLEKCPMPEGSKVFTMKWLKTKAPTGMPEFTRDEFVGTQYWLNDVYPPEGEMICVPDEATRRIFHITKPFPTAPVQQYRLNQWPFFGTGASDIRSAWSAVKPAEPTA